MHRPESVAGVLLPAGPVGLQSGTGLGPLEHRHQPITRESDPQCRQECPDAGGQSGQETLQCGQVFDADPYISIPGAVTLLYNIFYNMTAPYVKYEEIID